MRHALALLGCLTIAALTVLAIGGSSAIDGPIVLAVTARHGLHRGDLLALAVGGVGLLTLLGLHRAAGRPVGRAPADPPHRRPVSPAAGRARG